MAPSSWLLLSLIGTPGIWANPLFRHNRRELYGPSSCSSSVIPVPTNEVQSSIIAQQEWNLCSYKSAQAMTTGTCSSYGQDAMTPFLTTQYVPNYGSTESRTFIASYLTEYATLTTSSAVTSTDCVGAEHVFPVGELGQGRLNYAIILVERAHC